MIDEAQRERLTRASELISEIEEFVEEFLSIEPEGDPGEVLIAIWLTKHRAHELKAEARLHHLAARDALLRAVDAILDGSSVNESAANNDFRESRRAVKRVEEQVASLRDYDAEETVALLAEVACNLNALMAKHGRYLGKRKRREARSVVDDLSRFSEGLSAGGLATRSGLEKLIECADRVSLYLASHPA